MIVFADDACCLEPIGSVDVHAAELILLSLAGCTLFPIANFVVKESFSGSRGIVAAFASMRKASLLRDF